MQQKNYMIKALIKRYFLLFYSLDSVWKVALTLFCSALLYAFMRYGVFGSARPQNFPAFLFNKGLALAAVLQLVAGWWYVLKRDYVQAKPLFTLGLYIGIWHGFISASLLGRGYFRDFMAVSWFNIAGEIIVTSGAFALTILCFIRFEKVRSYRLASGAVCITLITHLIPMGYYKWFNLERWNVLPPISLVSFCMVLTGLYFVVHSAENNKGTQL